MSNELRLLKWVTSMTLTAIVGFAGLVFAAPPANDTCAGAIPLTLNRSTVATNLDANDDYQTPDTAACYSGIGQQPTKAEGRDVVFSFTAPADGKYTFGFITFNPNDTTGGTAFNHVLYLTDCANSGTVNCVRGVNRGNPPRGFTTGASNGFHQGNAEAIDCVPMTAGQTHFLVFDDRATGKCSPLDPPGGRASNCYQDSDCQTPGAVCNKVLNAGGRIMIEVRECHAEVEPNDTPATANPYNYCGMVGETHVAPAFHCNLGNRAGNVCVRSGFLPQDHPDSKMICSISGGPCSVDTLLGTSTCPGGPTDLCQGQVDPDCDSRCDVGPNAGKTCATQAFCNPGGDQGATCVGSCVADTTCVDNLTGANTGVACTPVCVGSATPGVNGRFCSALSGCPGGGVCTVTPNPPTPGATCLAGQTCTRDYNEGDTDFYSLGVIPSGWTVFANVNSSAANDGDYRLRVTTDTQTLQFDDDDGFSRDNQSSPVIAGALATGTPTYLEVSKTQFRASAAYEVRAIVRPPLSQAQLEDETDPVGNDNYYPWPGDIFYISAIDNGVNNGYVRGTFAYNFDTDCWKFLANEGDVMDWFGAANPQRTAVGLTRIDHPEPFILDATPAGITQFLWNGNPVKNTTPNVPQPSLKAISPAVTSTHVQWRAQYTGMFEVCFASARQSIGQGVPSYSTNWSGSLTSNCGPVQAAGWGTTTTDVSVVKTGPAGPVTSGDIIDYTITVTNNGSQIAQEVAIDDTLDPNLTFISLTVDDGFGGSAHNFEGLLFLGNNTVCTSLYPIYCINASMAPGTTTTYTLRVQVKNCLEAETVIYNHVVLTQLSTDPNPNNDDSVHSFTAVPAPNNGCTDTIFSGEEEIPNLCTVNDTCQAGVCVSGGPPNCDDNSVCTDDSCDPASGCAVTNNTAACDDGLGCTIEDVCANGACGGTPITAPPETQNVFASNKTTYNWSPAAFATSYDVVRGGVGALPVGPGGGDEVCFGNLAGPTLNDPEEPPNGTAFFYLSRGQNSCGSGTYGFEGFHGAPGAPRVTTTCP